MVCVCMESRSSTKQPDCHLAKELIDNCLIADMVSRQSSLQEQPQRQLWLVLDQSVDDLETELEYLLTFHQPTIVL